MASSGTRVGSVAKAARVLQAFTPLVASLSVRQVAERTGIPRSTAHAICLTLCDAGLLEEGTGRGYRLGPALVGLGGQVIERTGPALGIAFSDQLLHGWDLAIATGQDATMPDGLAQAAYDMIHGRFTDEQRRGVFKPEIAVARDASAQDRQAFEAASELSRYFGGEPGLGPAQTPRAAGTAPPRAASLRRRGC